VVYFSGSDVTTIDAGSMIGAGNLVPAGPAAGVAEPGQMLALLNFPRQIVSYRIEAKHLDGSCFS